MPDRPKDALETERLDESAARRLIQRATELDASLAAESSVAELREAARGAGISDEAFQRALEEVRSPVPVAPPRAASPGTFLPRRFLLIAALAFVIGLMTLLFMRMAVVPLPVEEAVPAAPAVPATPPSTPQAVTPSGPAPRATTPPR